MPTITRTACSRPRSTVAIKAFRTVKPEIEEAVDCYALGHDTASVFHLMRVLEHGIWELAASVNLTFDIQQRHTIIEQIASEIGEFGKRWPASTARSGWMQFYSAAAKEFMHFKEGWRNHVSHNRATYDEPSARSVL